MVEAAFHWVAWLPFITQQSFGCSQPNACKRDTLSCDTRSSLVRIYSVNYIVDWHRFLSAPPTQRLSCLANYERRSMHIDKISFDQITWVSCSLNEFNINWFPQVFGAVHLIPIAIVTLMVKQFRCERWAMARIYSVAFLLGSQIDRHRTTQHNTHTHSIRVDPFRTSENQ